MSIFEKPELEDVEILPEEVAQQQLSPIKDREKAEHFHRMILPTLIRRLFLFINGEAEREQIDLFHTLMVEKLLTPAYFDRVLEAQAASLEVLYELAIEHGYLERQELSTNALVFLHTPDSIQKLYQPNDQSAP